MSRIARITTLAPFRCGFPARSIRPHVVLGLAVLALTVGIAVAQPAAPPPPAWVERSNANAQGLMGVFARFNPEMAGFFGMPGLDEQIMDLTPGFDERRLAAVRQEVQALQAKLTTESDPAVKQDLEILIKAGSEDIEGTELNNRLTVPYFSVSSTVFQGLRALLDDQVPAERRKAAVVRLRRYAGGEKGYQPLTELAEARIRSRLQTPGLLAPIKEEVERELGNSAAYVQGIEELFKKHGVGGYEKSYKELAKQLTAYDEFIRTEVLPRARTDFRQPRELYAYNLKTVGVDMPVDELTSRAQVAFAEIQVQMQTLAPLVAKEKGWSLQDYREVIRELKKQQVVGEAILPLYEGRIREIETIIRAQKIVTLPSRDMRIQLASEAESAAIPAPNMRPPRLIGNTGEMGTFVLPLRIPAKPGEGQLTFDDFTHEAASWTLTAHEGRPGHELQFASIIERGVSLARVLFAFNSVNVEGWGLYAESELQPYEPLEGQLITLQSRLMRAARAFLDPGLQLGEITREQATRVLREDVCLSEAMALQEVQRYTFLAPAQATAYFVGYNRLLETRALTERALGEHFDRKAFNDFVLAQGLLPPALLRRAVLEEFVPSQTASR